MGFNLFLDSIDSVNAHKFKGFSRSRINAEPPFSALTALPIESNLDNFSFVNNYFSHLSNSVFDPMSPNYAWRFIPAEPFSKVTVPIDDTGASVDFNQFKPSKLINVEHVEELRKELNNDWDDLKADIWNFIQCEQKKRQEKERYMSSAQATSDYFSSTISPKSTNSTSSSSTSESDKSSFNLLSSSYFDTHNHKMQNIAPYPEKQFGYTLLPGVAKAPVNSMNAMPTSTTNFEPNNSANLASLFSNENMSLEDSLKPKRLHVSNIPFRYRDSDLRKLFSQYGHILNCEVIFNERGSKGFGFVTFVNSKCADSARDCLNGQLLDGRKIEVNNATIRNTKKSGNSSHARWSVEPEQFSSPIFHSFTESACRANCLCQQIDVASRQTEPN